MKPTDDIKKAVADWINRGAPFNEGVGIYSQAYKGRVFIGGETRYADKLLAELCKLAQLDFQKQRARLVVIRRNPSVHFDKLSSHIDAQKVVFSNTKPDHPEEKNSGGYEHEMPDPVKDENRRGYPVQVIRVIDEYAKLFKERGILHSKMGSLPDDNHDATVKERKSLFDKVKELSLRLEKLYEAKEAWFNEKVLPDELALWPEEEPDSYLELPDDPATLKRIKKNIQTQIAKTQVRIDYQDERKGETKHPMPPGPKRERLEKKIVGWRKKVEEIDYMLNKFI